MSPGRVCLAFYGIVFVLICTAPPSLTAADGLVCTRSVSDSQYGRQALANLTTWRNTLWERTARHYAAITHGVHQKSHEELVEPQDASRWALFDPFVECPPHAPLMHVGKQGDGGKFLCDVRTLKAPCTIFSLGSNNDYTFEEDMLKLTPCKVHTFDCTVAQGKSVGANHEFHKLCIGSAQHERFITITDATQRFAPDGVDLLKMDIESFEYEVFAAWQQNSTMLPQVVSFELHAQMIGSVAGGEAKHAIHFSGNKFLPLFEISLLMFHLADIGYGIVSSEINPLWNLGCEFTMVRVEFPSNQFMT